MTEMLNSLPSDWLAVVAPLEQHEVCSLEVVIRTLRNEIMKQSASDDVIEVSMASSKTPRSRRQKKRDNAAPVS